MMQLAFEVETNATRYPPQAQNKSVSLMSMPGKIMDQILLEIIVKHMENKGVMGDSKHGFSEGKLRLKTLVAFCDGYRDPSPASVDMFERLNVLLEMREPELDTGSEVQPHQCPAQGDSHCPAPAGHTIADPPRIPEAFLATWVMFSCC
ncbi:hypothetical protein DUI87_09165 [Hirundo rustica rustica]|uniref:Reverse transcriptase domain-containing protein n=1 Tax=Hirundo rustica rustica TaxID=333673 RepID=A0A3M0L448_HIRRU|nr:hypothetical protein DUI87_09165 [Hirundo rustica rustica]